MASGVWRVVYGEWCMASVPIEDDDVVRVHVARVEVLHHVQ
jgi:hypothetical protein